MALMPVSLPNPSAAAKDYGSYLARRLFTGRRGHGQGPIVARRLSEAELGAIIAIAYQAGKEGR